ncbi:DUF4381 domain-containing protein [Marinobacter sp. R17]|uniref:DUF4381 domain-containing protein n=1 Tax=Marinobacter sp. R17 TaxID=2484250 RepID=UPI001CC1D222|nr:DUF4381 domain-containing protein [Marinobacter sp. R17]
MTQAVQQPMNQGDPLAQLRDIHLPEPGGFWPPAPGWWILAALVLILVAAVLWWFWRRHRRNRWIHDAKQELARLSASARSDNDWFTELNALLKRCARQRYPDQHPDALSGSQWTDFLARTEPTLERQQVEALVNAAWRPSPGIEPDQARALAERWLGGQKC